METKLDVYNVDDSYSKYLHCFEDKVRFSWNEKQRRPYIGIILEVGDYKYFAPFSSPKPKYLNMNNAIDFIKIDGGRMGVINFNNMIPIIDEAVILMDKQIRNADSIEDMKYKKLVNEQLTWCNELDNKNKIITSARNLYHLKMNGQLKPHVDMRCNDFGLLEVAQDIFVEAMHKYGDNIEISEDFIDEAKQMYTDGFQKRDIVDAAIRKIGNELGIGGIHF